MVQRTRLLRTPDPTDPNKDRLAKLFSQAIIPQTIIVILFMAGLTASDPSEILRYSITAIVMTIEGIAVLLLVRSGHLVTAAAFNSLLLYSAISVNSFIGGNGIYAPALSLYFYFILSTGVFLGNGAGLAAAFLALATSAALVFLFPPPGGHPYQVSHTPIEQFLFVATGTIMFVVLQRISRESVLGALRRANEEIAERRKAEESVRQSEEHLAYLARGAFEGLSIVADDKIVESNGQIASMFGFELSELRGKDTIELIAPEMRDRVRELRTIPEVTSELVGIRKDGSRFPIEVRRRPMLYFGKQVHVVAVRDMTEYKKQEAKRQESEALYRDLVENVRDAVFALAPDGTVTSLNPAFETITGWRPEEWIGLTFDRLAHPDEAASARAVFQRVVQGNAGTAAEFRFRKKDGGYALVEILAAPRFHDGKVVSVLGIARDITERRGLEEQVKRVQRLESLGALAGGIAHDLNNVLAPILISIQLLRDSISDPAARDAAADTLSIIERSARRGADVVKQVLTFARGQGSDRTTVQLRYIMREITSVLENTFPKNLEIVSSTDRDLRVVNANATQMHQVIMNLCVNARDAMPDGGTLTITARNVSDENPGGEWVELRVRDTGTGIHEDIRKNIFEPFFTTKEQGRGTGLGLSTVASIVRDHAGTIDVESAVGKGSTFVVRFPAAQDPGREVETGERPEPLPRGRGERILVVDDERSITQICRETLEAYGYAVDTAANGAEAIAAVADAPSGYFDLVLSDLNMPMIDGSRATHAIRRIDDAIRIVIMSGTEPRDGKSDPADGDVTPYSVSKPFTAEQLLRVVRDALTNPDT